MKVYNKGGKNMNTENDYFNAALPMHDYIEQMTVEVLKERTEKIYNAFEVPADADLSGLKNKKILAITEDWCGDAMLNNPIMLKIAEAAGAEMRAAFRDADTDLIDRHLTNGGRAIPIYLFLNEEGDLVGKWGPRAPELQQFVTEGRAALPAKEDDGYAEAEKAFYASLQQRYVDDSQTWEWVSNDIVKTIQAL